MWLQDKKGKQFKKALLIALLFVFLIAFLGKGYQGGGEYKFNFLKTQDKCKETGAVKNCEEYTPLFHILASPFAFSENSFWYFSVILLGLIIPMIFYFLTKNWFSVWLYYSTTSAFYFLIDGVMPQALALGLCLLILTVKDWRLQLAILFVSIFAHGHGFLLVLTAFIVNRIWLLIIDKECNWNNILLSCSGVFGLARPEILDTKIVTENTIIRGPAAYHITLTNIVSLFTKIFPAPLYVIAFYYSVKHKYRIDLIVMAGLALLFGFLPGGSHRSWYLIPMMLIPAVSMFYMDENLSKRHKLWLFSFTVLTFILQVWSWWNYKILCQ